MIPPVNSCGPLPIVTAIALVSVREPFDDPDCYEPKWDGFRALAYLEDDRCKLVSRRGHVYRA